MTTPNPITASVGDQGANVRADVIEVQTLLDTQGFDPGGVDGDCGPQTIAAIRRFQHTFMATPDGLIEPGKTTWMRLSVGDVVPPPSIPSAPSSPSAPIGEWSGDSSQWTQEKKIASMKPELRPKVQAVIAALSGRGFQPRIFFAWRSVAVQLQILAEGNTTVKFSFHNAQKPDGTPNAYAADIIDTRYAWTPQAESSGFWQALGEEARNQGLFWGGDWITFKDWAHVQLVDNPQLGQVRQESGL